MKFKILNEAWRVGFELKDLLYGKGEIEHHEILINPSPSEVFEEDKGIIDLDGNVYVDKPILDKFQISHAIHSDILQKMIELGEFKSPPKLMVYKSFGNQWRIANDDNNAIKNVKEFNAIRDRLKGKTGATLTPTFKGWMEETP